MQAKTKNVVLYDFLQVKGGAEAVTLDLYNHFSNLDLIVSWINQDNFSNADLDPNRVYSLSNNTDLLGWQTIKSALLFKHRCPDLSQYETAIFSGSNAPLAILESKAKKNIYYCHTPPRFVYDLRDFYLDSIPLWQKPLLKSLINWFQPQFEDALEQMDSILCNSLNVKNRLSKYIGLEAEVVYPPVNTTRFKLIAAGDYYLSTARLESYKRIETIVRAFMKMPDKKLVVASGGSQEAYLRELAKDYTNISFTGWLSEKELCDLVGNCFATVYIPIDEDFGMSPVESMAAGKPVIGSASGGILETVVHKKTGWLTPEKCELKDVIDAVEGLEVMDLEILKENCMRRALEFSPASFFNRMSGIIAKEGRN